MSISNPQKVSAKAYLICTPDIYGSGDYRYVHEVRVTDVRKGKPALRRGQVAVRVKLVFDERALIESVPEVEVEVPSFVVPEPEAEVVPEPEVELAEVEP